MHYPNFCAVTSCPILETGPGHIVLSVRVPPDMSRVRSDKYRSGAELVLAP